MNNHIYNKYLYRKRFGQNILVDKAVIKNIVNFINPKPNEIIIEIGPGPGNLTEAVGNLINKLTVIEIDRNLVAQLKMNMCLKNKLTIIQKDVMNVDFNIFLEYKTQFIRIFGNLPYNISTNLIFYLFSFNNFIYDMIFMLQKEVVDRLIAKPNTKSYGYLSVIAQYYCDINKLLDVSPMSFIPVPNVNSAIVKLTPRRKNKYFVKNIDFLKQITKQAFNQRRKIILNSLKSLVKPEIFTILNINPIIRAENISIEEYCKIANYLYDLNIKY